MLHIAPLMLLAGAFSPYATSFAAFSNTQNCLTIRRDCTLMGATKNSVQDFTARAITRRKVASTFVTSASLIFASPAFADPMESSTALRNVRKSLKELEDLESLVSEKDYPAIKSALRVPPFTELRKSCNVVIARTQEGRDVETMKVQYSTFIKGIEGLDSKVALALRGKKGVEIKGSYKVALKALTIFNEAAERVYSVN